MITVAGRGKYWYKKKPMLLLLADGEEAESVKNTYHFNYPKGEEKVRYIPIDEFNFTNDIESGRYRLYDVKNEQSSEDGIHLELSAGAGKWNCYILPLGLPDKDNLEKSVFSTNECITKCGC